jgi:hypothetical protein
LCFLCIGTTIGQLLGKNYFQYTYKKTNLVNIT